MRIRRLELKAFGPFSDCRIEFSGECPGLHVVYGPNEAGKSSCLRALKSLFFGIPARTGDNFLHSYDQLLIGGCICGDDGDELTFFRRKKRKADLFDPNDDPLDPSLLASFLNGMEQETFESLYGIDHESLQRGGQEILDQKGNVGQAIFAAGAGLTSLRSVLDDLEKEGDGLYRPRASTRAINDALSEYRKLQVELRQALLSSGEWEDHRKTLQRAQQDLENASRLRGEKAAEKRRLERLQRALSHLARRRDLLLKLGEMGEVPVLAPDFGDRRRKLEQGRRDAQNRLETATLRIGALRQKKGGISLQQELLNRADLIEDFHQRLGEYRKGIKDRPEREGMRIACRTDAAVLLKQIRPDLRLEEAERLRTGLLKRKTVQDLGSRYEALVQGVDHRDREIRSLRKELDKTRDEAAALPAAKNPRELTEAVKMVQKAGDLDRELNTRRRALDAIKKDCGGALSRLGMWNGTLQQAAALPLPLIETIDRFEEAFNTIKDKNRVLKGEEERLRNERDGFSAQLGELRYAGEVPTEKELAEIRSRRDDGWQLLKRQWIDGDDISKEASALSPDAPLPEAYERLVALSDQTSDRLRREADRVQKYASIQAAIESIEERLSRLQTEAEDAEKDLARAETRWNSLWACCRIAPLPPREMRSWFSRFEKIRFQIEEIGCGESEIESKEDHRRRMRETLIQELSGIDECREFQGEEIDPVLRHAETLLERIQDEESRREKLVNRVADLQNALTSAQDTRDEAVEKLNRWRVQWKEALLPLELPPNASAAEAIELIEALKNIFDKLKEADEFRKRIDGIDRDVRNYEEGLSELLSEIAPDLKGSGAIDAVSILQGRLNAARQSDAVWRRHSEEIESLEKEILQDQTALKSCREQMAVLIQAAGCTREEELDEAEQRSNTCRQLKEKLSEIDSTLSHIAEGVSVSDLEDQARGTDPDALQGKIEALSLEIEERLDPEIRSLSEIIGREKNEMARMSGSGHAADLADASQQSLARIRRLTEQFIRLRLAAKILREVIERYRAEHQDPVLKLASGYFKALTLGSFAGLRADIDDSDQAILIGIRPNGARIRVEGMSSGTRDQLYLALRLASLEWRLESGSRMPFIVDDILINFDDDRSTATLSALAVLARKNQVILFTHHRHIVESARAMGIEEGVFIHEL